MIEKVAVLGDSILRCVVWDEAGGRYIHLKENCAQQVQQALGIQIDNFARYGMTSEKGLKTERQKIFPGCGYDAAVICFGGNDVDHDWPEVAAHPRAENPPKVSPGDFEHNLSAMIADLRAKGVEPILMTLPPIDSSRYFRFFSRNIPHPDQILTWLGSVQTIYEFHNFYSSAIKRLASRCGCRIIDIRTPFLQGDYSDLLCLDGIHPNRAGHTLMSHIFINYAHACGI